MPLVIERDQITKDDYKDKINLSWSFKTEIPVEQPEAWLQEKPKCESYIAKSFDLRRSFKVRDLEFILPVSLQNIFKEIEESQYLFDLEFDWDDQGGTAVNENSWRKASELIINYAIWLYENYDRFVLTPPQINSGPENSIDLLWRSSKFRLLINIPNNVDGPITYYGDNNKGKNSLKGILESESVHEYFALWLKDLSK